MAFPTYYVVFLPSSLSASFNDSTVWGAGGAPLATQVTSAILTISLPDSDYMPDPTNTTTIDLFARGYPITNPITLTSVDFGQLLVTDKFGDGVYGFSLLMGYEDDSGEVTVTTVWYGYKYSINQCCADNMSNTSGCQCDECLTHKQINLLKMRLDFFAISLNQTFCQNNLNAAKAIKDASELCAGRACGVCGC